MRTTLTIDDDILDIAKADAETSGESIGRVISRLARRGYQAECAPIAYPSGFRPLHARPDMPPATLELVNAIRDDAS